MKTTQAMTDKLAIGLSFMCAIHCLMLPALLVLLPSLSALHLDNEAFHRWMLIAVIPCSLYALTLGCKQHKHYRFFVMGSIGLVLLVVALLAEEYIGEQGEKILTLIGASFIAIGHWLNYKLCRQMANEDCTCSHKSDIDS